MSQQVSKTSSQRDSQDASGRTVRAVGGEWVISRRWPVLLLAAATGVLMSLLFEPFAYWPLAYFCLVPWLMAVVCSQRRGWMFLTSYLLGVCFFLFNFHWLWPVTNWPPQGIPLASLRVRIPVGTVLLALYLGVYFPVAAWLIRFLYRRCRVPLTLAVPIIWTSTEYVRAFLPIVPYDGRWQYTGLQWFYLAHSHYKILPMVQIADLAGAYGVSFVLAMMNGWITDLLVEPILWFSPNLVRWNRRLRWLTCLAVGTLAATLIYGIFRLRTEPLKPGPRIAVIQTDFPLFVSAGGWVNSANEIISEVTHLILDEAASAGPDIIVLPETTWPVPLNREFREASGYENKAVQAYAKACHERLKKLALQTNATLVVGAISVEPHPERPYLQEERFNSVFVYRPGEDEPQRYDKIHLVLFGEFVPFRRGKLHRLYRWINARMPWGQTGFEYSLTAGTEYKVFTAPAHTQGGQEYRFGTPICYEIVMSHACRAFCYGLEGKRADLLINLSNDGWFQYKSELPQHLAVAVFRAIENRVGLARAVNTGISALVSPTGKIIKAMTKDGQWRKPAPAGWPLKWRGFVGVLVDEVPTDPRITLYVRWGDWLGKLSLLAAAVTAVLWWLDRSRIAWRHIRRSRAAGSEHHGKGA